MQTDSDNEKEEHSATSTDTGSLYCDCQCSVTHCRLNNLFMLYAHTGLMSQMHLTYPVLQSSLCL